MKTCPKCNKEVVEGWKLCPYCGESLQINECPACHKQVQPDWNRCPFCGELLKNQASQTPSVSNSTNDLFDYSEIEAGFDRQLAHNAEYEKNLVKARAYAVRGKYAEATEIYEKMLEDDPADMNGYMGLIRVATRSYTEYEGDEIEETIRIAKQMSGGEEIGQYDPDYADYSACREKYFADKTEAERKAKEEAERKAREEAERKAKEEAECKAKAEAERKAKEEAERKAKAEAERKAREEAERKAKEEAERKAKEEAARKTREEAERKAKVEAERKAREDAAIPHREGNKIIFGLWPQSRKAYDVTVEDSADKDGYYMGSDGALYEKVVMRLFEDTEDEFSLDLYYKVEPIEWQILSESGGKAIILSKAILANMAYHGSRNNYANSDVRKWLNGAFYDKAFSAKSKNYIETATLDNSVEEIRDSSYPYTCNNTNDKVYLLSYAEAYGFKEAYGLTDSSRQKKPTEYAKETGALVDSDNGNGWWWLRSQYCSPSGNGAFAVGADGKLKFGGYIDEHCGVVPALLIRL